MAGNAIFIGQRSDDAAQESAQIFDAMARRFGRSRVFTGAESIGPGVNFGDHIKSVLLKCRVALVLIGPHWLGAKDETGGRLIDSCHDCTRIEIETALTTPGLNVVPVLMNGANMPLAEEVPESLRPLLCRNPSYIRCGEYLDEDVTRLAEQIRAKRTYGVVSLAFVRRDARLASSIAARLRTRGLAVIIREDDTERPLLSPTIFICSRNSARSRSFSEHVAEQGRGHLAVLTHGADKRYVPNGVDEVFSSNDPDSIIRAVERRMDLELPNAGSLGPLRCGHIWPKFFKGTRFAAELYGHVFISHAGADSTRIRSTIIQPTGMQVASDLKHDMPDVCFLHSSGSPASYLELIFGALNTSRAALVVVTKNSAKHKWVRAEVDWLLCHRKQLGVCLLDSVDPREVHPGMAVGRSYPKYFDFRNDADAATFELRRWLTLD